MTRKKRPEHDVGSGNVFADLGFPDAGEHYVKAQIVAEIHKLIKNRKLTQTKAGALMGIGQPSVSRMLRGHFREYSVERLLQFLTVFDRDVEIVIRRREKPGKRGQVTVRAA
jgi:predicted XRE-type DNA-binding protein